MTVVTLLIIAGLVGIHYEVVAVVISTFLVMPGDSITIPCHYDQEFKDHIKLLCEGEYWRKCQIVLTSSQSEPTSERFSLTDNTSQGMFTVTINNVTRDDKYFWCGVKSKTERDDILKIKLNVPKGVHVKQQEITGFEGGNVAAMWYIANPKTPEWCRIGVESCIKKSGWIDEVYVKIERISHGAYRMEMMNLSMKSSGWYYCVNDDFERYVHLSVQPPPASTTTAASMTTLSTPNTSETNAIIHTPCGGSNQVQQKSSKMMMMMIIPPLITLLLTVPAAILGWVMRARCATKPDQHDCTTESQNPDSNLHYASIVHNRHAPVGTEQRHIPTENVTYSTIAFPNNVHSEIELADGLAIYSTPKKV